MKKKKIAEHRKGLWDTIKSITSKIGVPQRVREKEAEKLCEDTRTKIFPSLMNVACSKTSGPHHTEVSLSNTDSWFLFRSHGGQKAMDDIFKVLKKKTLSTKVYIQQNSPSKPEAMKMSPEQKQKRWVCASRPAEEVLRANTKGPYTVM